ncbi:MAG: hypothetical protein GTO41_28205 [Burkholderiales bacterium]|nr:hypothetical protein [Burkholderiales bacterium]
MNGLRQGAYGLWNPTWLAAVRAYMVAVAIGSLIWEFAQLPLYTIWTEGTTGEIAFAVLHCTAGDVLIAAIALLAALVLVGDARWPARRFVHVAPLAITFAVLYTVFSEWLNVEVRSGWAYSDFMPTLPVLRTGLSPLAQWIVVPAISFWWVRRASVVVDNNFEDLHR